MGNRAPSGGRGDQSRTSVGSRSTAGGAAVGGAAGGQKGGNSEEKKTNPEQKAKPNVYTYTSPKVSPNTVKPHQVKHLGHQGNNFK